MTKSSKPETLNERDLDDVQAGAATKMVEIMYTCKGPDSGGALTKQTAGDDAAYEENVTLNFAQVHVEPKE